MKNFTPLIRALGRGLSSLVLVAAIAVPPEPAFPQSRSTTTRYNSITAALTDLKLSTKRWLEIDLSSQRLIAWEGSQPVYAVIISTGKATTPTPTGIFAIQTRHRVARMQGYDYDVPDVPYTMYYHRGYAIHGAYWHSRFGTPVSHGCINVAVNHARWLYHWATVGTPVVVHS
jgi:lipoprotein-anchoring transpeptidase ErfK/SrfK